MVIEAKSIKGSVKGLRYQADDKSHAIEISRSGIIGDNPKDWHKQMRNVEIQNKRVVNSRFSVVLAPSKEVSKNLSIYDWENLVNSYLDKMGIDKDNHQYISHLHTSTDDPHVHLTISRIPMESGNAMKFNAINDNNIGIRSGTIADKIAKENGWRTAKEISASKRQAIEHALRIELKSAISFADLSKRMEQHGFIINLFENEAKGIYGMRILLREDINEKESERAISSKKGYKLSELNRFPDKKTKYKISDIKSILERNLFKTLSPAERILFAENKTSQISETQNINNPVSQKDHGSSNVPNKPSILENLLKPTYASSGQDDLSKKKRKKKR